MDQDKDESAREGVNIRGFGFGLKATGEHAAALVKIALALIVIGYMLWQHDSNAKERAQAIEARSLQRSEDAAAAMRLVVERLDEQSYILTRTEEERRRLNLAMPEGLRHKLRGRE